jgi:hypothetical protein
VLIEIEISGDGNVIKKESEKVLKWKHLTIEIHRMSNVKTEMIPIVTGANGTISKSFRKFNVFHVRALYYTKTLITNKCTKRVLSSIVTHSYIFRPCWVIFRENF